MNNPERKPKDRTEISPDFFPFQLTDVQLYEVRIERREPEKEEGKKIPLELRLYAGDEPLDADEFDLLVTFKATLPDVDIFLALEGQFESIVDTDTLKPEVVQQFRSSDSIILFWPYLRQTLHDFTTRMGLNIGLLPILDPRSLVQRPIGREAEETPQK